MSNFLDAIRQRVKALEPHADMSVLKKSVNEQLNFLLAHREAFVQAWLAETGIHPSQCMLVENRSYDGSSSVSIVAKSQKQIDAEIKAAKPKPVIVADYLSPDPFSITVSGKCSRWFQNTYRVGLQPEGAVLVPGSEREEE